MGARRARAALGAAVAGTVTMALALAACTSGAAQPAAQSAPAPASSASTGSSASSAPAPSSAAGDAAAPASPPARVCGNASALSGPATAPAGAVRVPAGDNAKVNLARPDTTYWLAPGVHTLGGGEFASIQPASHDTYVGAPGAVLDGAHVNDSAFGGDADHVTVEYLTIRNFGTPGGGAQEGVVNHDSGPYWTIEHSTVSGNAGAGVMLGSHDALRSDCLADNQQYGFNAYFGGGKITGLVIDHNEIAGNDTYDYEARQPGCGCSGGGKFWNVYDATVTGNWVHGNKSVGLWADTNNAGFLFAGNYIADNAGVGLEYEISYNAEITANTFNHNGAVIGPTGPGFPTSAIYLSESGSDSRVNSNYRNSPFLIARNVFLNNWGGVILWESSNRFCASPNNTSTGYCTVVNPKATLKTCGNHDLIKQEPYLSDCRWKTQDALVEDNTFSFTPAAVGKDCTAKNLCGYNGVFSQYGTDPPWSPYKADLVPDDIAYHQDNKFTDNTYRGPWCFMGWELGTSVDFKQWQAPASLSDKQFGQDARSTHAGANGPCSLS